MYAASDAGDTPFLSVIEDPAHRPDVSRLAFRASGAAQLGRAAEAARQAGARDFEAPAPCPEYTPSCDAAFFSDPSGNLLEICHR